MNNGINMIIAESYFMVIYIYLYHRSFSHILLLILESFFTTV